jgi:hypothetical protein
MHAKLHVQANQEFAEASWSHFNVALSGTFVLPPSNALVPQHFGPEQTKMVQKSSRLWGGNCWIVEALKRMRAEPAWTKRGLETAATSP